MNKNLITLALLFSLGACDTDTDDSNIDLETPENTPAVFSGASSAAIDTDVDALSGQLIVTDVDDNESSTVAQNNTATSYGTFTINTAGDWTYTLDTANSDVAALASASDTLTDTISVESADGTATSIVITISGIDAVVVNSPATFSGDLTETVFDTESGVVTGSITVADTDSGEDTIVAQTDAVTNYGSVSITASGDWTYDLDETNSNVVALDDSSAPLTDSIVVTSFDGTTTDLVITIEHDAVVSTGNGFSASEGGNHIDGYTDNVPTINCTQTVSSISELEDAADDIQAGDTLCLADGTYSGDLQLRVDAFGTADNPVTVAAETSGGAVITDGEMYIRIGGEHVVIQGFVLRDGESGSSIIKFEAENECSYCRVTEVSVIDMDKGDYGSSKWVEYYGQYNRIDHSWFSGKESRGALLVLGRWISSDDFATSGFPADHAQIDYNYIGNRPPAFGRAYAGSSDNEYEGVRLGLSTTHSAPSYTVLENNYFERIQGEVEVISNKSANNFIRNNTIRNSTGSIVNRHGANVDISHNFVFGDDHPYSGGIRIVDDGHTVTNNYVEGARNLSSNWNGGIVLTTGDDAGDGDNGYQNVENVLVAHNTIVDSVNSINVYGGNNDEAPTNIYFVNNIVADAIGPVIRTNDEDMPTNSTFAGNYIYGQAFSDNSDVAEGSTVGFSYIDAMLEKSNDGLYRPSSNSPALAAADEAVGTFTLPTVDMDGQTRSTATTSGSDEDSTEAASLAPLTTADVGPINYRPTPGKVYVDEVTIANHDFDSGDLTGWVDTNGAGAQIISDDDVFSRGHSLKIDSATGQVTQVVNLTANTNYTLSAYTKGTALLGVTLADNTKVNTDTDNGSYKFTSVTFNSGANTSATIVASLPDTLPIRADIVNADFADKLNDWVVIENDDVTDGLGDVGDSSDSAVSGSRAAKFNYRYANDNNSTPGLYQDVTVLPNTDYNLSMYVLVKSSASGTTATFGVKDPADGSVLFSKVADYDALEAAGAPKGTNKDHYQDVLSFNSGNATTVRVYAEMDAVSMNASHIPADATTEMNSSDRKIYEVRVDDFELSYEDVPPSGSEAFFDSIRLVSHPLSPAESTVAEDD